MSEKLMKKVLIQLSKVIYDLDEFLEKYEPTAEEAMIEYQLCVDRIRDIVETEMQISYMDKESSWQLFTEAI